MNTKEQAEREYRAQWIRDAARDMILAHLSVGAEMDADQVAIYLDRAPQHTFILASSLWDLYVKERG